MSRTITVGALRQNPTPMLREVKAGATYTITDHGDPIADVTAHRRTRWIPACQIDALLRDLGGDPDFAGDMVAARAAELSRDPWTDTD